MAIGGLFPLPITDPVFGGGQIALTSGGVFYPPSGRYLMTTGQVTGLQSWDVAQQLWRNTTLPQVDNQLIVCDGANQRVINYSGTVQAAAITAAGSGGTNGIGAAATGVLVTIAAPAAPGQTATAYAIVGGAIVAPTVMQAGSGFLVPPFVVIDAPPPGGIQATATCALTAPGGGIASITMLNPGAGYTAANPGFYLIPQPGTYQGAPSGSFAAGAFPPPGLVDPTNTVPGVAPIFLTGTGNAKLNPATLTGSGTLTGLVLVNNGSFYTGTTIPAITITGCGAATAVALMNLVMTGVSGLSGGAGYTGNPPIFITSLGDVVVGGVTVSYNNNNTFDGKPARGVTTIGGGTVTGFIIEDPGFGFQKVPSLAILNGGSIATGQAAATVVCGGITDTCILQAKVNV